MAPVPSAYNCASGQRPTPAESAHEEAPTGPSDNEASPHEDPSGPHAKTAELKGPARPSPADATAAASVTCLARRRERVGGGRACGLQWRQSSRPQPAAAASGIEETAAAVTEGGNNEVAQAPAAAARAAGATEPLTLDEAMAHSGPAPASAPETSAASESTVTEGAAHENSRRTCRRPG